MSLITILLLHVSEPNLVFRLDKQAGVCGQAPWIPPIDRGERGSEKHSRI